MDNSPALPAPTSSTPSSNGLTGALRAFLKTFALSRGRPATATAQERALLAVLAVVPHATGKTDWADLP